MDLLTLPLGLVDSRRPGAPELPVSFLTRQRSQEADAAMALDDWSDYFPPPGPAAPAPEQPPMPGWPGPSPR